MKYVLKHVRVSLVALTVAFCGLTASAQTTYNWTNASGTDLFWSTPGNWSPSGVPGAVDTAYFNNNALTNGVGSAFADNIVTASTSIKDLIYSNNTAGSFHNTLLNPGVTLILSNNNVAGDNNLIVGTGLALTGPITNTLSGPGAALVVTNASGSITLRSTSGGNTSQNTVFDMSALDNFSAGVGRLTVGADAVFNREVGTLLLAKTNIIRTMGTAPQINVGDQPANGVGANNDPTLQESFIYLGQTNAIYSDSITIGREKSSGALKFNPAYTNGGNPTVYIRGNGATRVAALAVSDQSALGNSNQRSLGLVDLTGGTIDAMIGTANIGLGKNGNNTATAASENATLTFSQGTVDVNTLNIGCAFVATSTGIGPIGVVNVNGTGALVVNTVVNLANKGATPGTPSTGTLNINGGTATIKGPIVNGGGAAAVGVNSGSINAGFSGVVIGTLASPITTLSLTNATLTLAPTFAATNVVVATLNTVSGTTNKINIGIMPPIISYPAQVPLIQFTTSVGDLTTFVLGSVPSASPAFQGYITNDGVGQVYLYLTNGVVGTPPPAPKTDVWNGAPNGNWDTTTTNWVNSGVPTNYANVTTSGLGDPVTFDDTLLGTTNVVLTISLSPASITVNNTAKPYNFSGSGKLTGAIGLIKQGTGSLILKESGSDNYSGGLIVSNGTLVIDNDSSAVTGGTTIAGGTLQIGNNDANGVPPGGIITNSSTLVFNRSDNTLTLANIITGTGSLVQNGPGTVTLTAVSTFTGATTVNGGTLITGGPNNNPSTLTTSSGLTINNGGTVLVSVDNSIAGSTGTLPITINAGGVLTGSATLNGGSGASSHIAGPLTLNGGTLTDGGTQLVLNNGTWDLDGGVTVPGNPITSTISTLSVIPHQTSGTVFNITNGSTPSGIDLNVTGTFINGTSIHDTGVILNGNGTMAFQNADTYAGATVINGGFLLLNNSNAVQNSTVTLNEDNGVKFGTNIGTFTFGGLAGASALTLADTGNHPVTLRVGGNNATTTYTGILGGSGSLTKVGTGTLILQTGTNLYTGATVISNGTLQLFDPVSLDNSPQVSLIASTAVLDPSGRADDAFTITNGQTLSGNGTVNGYLTNNGTLSPGLGSTTGTLTANNNVTLLGNTVIKIDKNNATNDEVISLGSVTYGGTLTINNLNAPFTTNDVFQVFFSSANNYSGTFSAIVPASPGSGLAWNTNNLVVNGTLSITNGPVTAPTTNANITKVSLSGTNVVIHGTNNNVPNTSGHYVVLTTPNITNALSNWTPVITNPFNPDGTFDYTNPIVPGTPRQFIDVEAVP